MKTRQHPRDTQRIERLLAAAAAFEPDAPAPADLERSALRKRRPARQPWAWRPAAAGACVLLLAVALWSRESQQEQPAPPALAPPALPVAPDPLIPEPAPRAVSGLPVAARNVASSDASAGDAKRLARPAAPARAARARRAPSPPVRKRAAPGRRARAVRPPMKERIAPPPARWRTYMVHEDTTHVMAPVWLVDRGDDGGVALRPAVANIPVQSTGLIRNADYIQEAP